MAKWPRGKGKREHEWEVDVCQSPQEEEEAAAEGGLCMVCVRLQVGERERVEMDRRLSYFFFSFSLAPF